MRDVIPGVSSDRKKKLVGLVGGVVDAPLVEVIIEVEERQRKATVCLTDKLLIKGIEMLLGNDAGSKMTIQNFLPRGGKGER